MKKCFTVSEKALFGRINRVLAKKSLRLHKTRLRSRSRDNLGRYYIRDTDTKTLVEHHIPLAMYANDLGVVSDLEQLEDSHHTDKEKGSCDDRTERRFPQTLKPNPVRSQARVQLTFFHRPSVVIFPSTR